MNNSNIPSCSSSDILISKEENLLKNGYELFENESRQYYEKNEIKIIDKRSEEADDEIETSGDDVIYL